MSEEVLQLKISDDKQTVVLLALPRDTTFSLIRDELQFMDVTTGILQKEIEEAVVKVAAGEDVKNLVVAQAGLLEVEIGFIPHNKKMSIGDMPRYKILLNRINTLLLGRKDIIKSDSKKEFADLLCFVQKGQAIFRISKMIHTVLGQEEEINPSHDVMDVEDTIEIVDKATYFEYLATETGYLMYNDLQRLDVFSPFKTAKDDTKLMCQIQSVTAGVKELEQYITEFADSTFLKESGTSPGALISQGFSTSCIRERIEAVEGADAELIISVEKKEIVADENDRMDYKSISSFLHVDQNQKIAKKKKAVVGVPGIDVWGEEIAVQEVRDDEFKVGDNITIDEQESEIVYTAAVEGVLYVNGNDINISEGLIIEGDVDATTGNIVYEKDVIIEGSLTEGFSIESQGNVQIQGSVGNHAVLRVKKNLEVIKGIFGEETSVYVNGNAEIGFVQESMVRVEGNCTIDRFIYQAKVFAGGVVVVEGNKVKVQTKGAIIGGVTNALHGIKAHSAGSVATKTELVVGVDLRLLEQVKELEEAFEATIKQIAILESAIGMDLSKNDSVNHLKTMTPRDKATMKEKLVTLKEAMERQKKLSIAQEQIKEKLAALNVTNSFVEIVTKLIPDVIIKLGKSTREIRTEETNIKFRSSYNEVLNEKDGKLFRDDGTMVGEVADDGSDDMAPKEDAKTETPTEQ